MRNKKQKRLISVFALVVLFLGGLFFKFDFGKKLKTFSKSEKKIDLGAVSGDSMAAADICKDIEAENEEAYLYAGCGGFF